MLKLSIYILFNIQTAFLIKLQCYYICVNLFYKSISSFSSVAQSCLLSTSSQQKEHQRRALGGMYPVAGAKQELHLPESPLLGATCLESAIRGVYSGSESTFQRHLKLHYFKRHYFANKGPSSHGYGFSSSHVWM